MIYVALNISHFMSAVWRCFPDSCHGLLETDLVRSGEELRNESGFQSSP